MTDRMSPTSVQLIAGHSIGADEVLEADPYVASSLLQKAIRRGEAEVAGRAAFALYRRRGDAIFRRLMVIAFEDVGIGAPEILVATVASAIGKSLGPELAVQIAWGLADAPKERSSDFLMSIAKDHPFYEDARERAGTASLTERLDLVADARLPLPLRATAAWFASGLNAGDEPRLGKGNLPGLSRVYRELGVPNDLATAAAIAASKTREPITVFVPLLWLAARQGKTPHASERLLPPSVDAGGVLSYAFDKHTRLGKLAIGRFASENDEVRRSLEEFVPAYRHRSAAFMAAFYADAAPVARRLVWDGCEPVEQLGTEADMIRAGVPQNGVGPILQVVRAELDHLNEIRGRLAGRPLLGRTR